MMRVCAKGSPVRGVHTLSKVRGLHPENVLFHVFRAEAGCLSQQFAYLESAEFKPPEYIYFVSCALYPRTIFRTSPLSGAVGFRVSIWRSVVVYDG